MSNPNHIFVVYSQNFRLNLRLKKIYSKYLIALAFKWIRSEEREDQQKAVFTLVQRTLKSYAKPAESFNNVFSYTPSNILAEQGNGQTFELLLCLLITHICTGLSPNHDLEQEGRRHSSHLSSAACQASADPKIPGNAPTPGQIIYY